MVFARSNPFGGCSTEKPLEDLAQQIWQAVEARDAMRVRADEDFRAELRRLHAEGHSLGEIGAVLEVSRQRIWQLVQED